MFLKPLDIAFLLFGMAYAALMIWVALSIPAAIRADATTACILNSQTFEARDACYANHGFN